MINLGAAIAGFSLGVFLVPNDVMDGGVTGLSIIISHITPWSLSLFIVLLNIPFLFIGYKRMGLRFAINTLYGIVTMSIVTGMFYQVDVMGSVFLSTVIGALILGIGVGVAIRMGGALDGTEILAIVISRHRRVSVGQIIMALNVFIFLLAGLVFTWESVFYSILTYAIAAGVIDWIVEREWRGRPTLT